MPPPLDHHTSSANSMPPPPRRQSNAQSTIVASGSRRTSSSGEGAAEDGADEDDSVEKDSTTPGTDPTVTDHIFSSLAAGEFDDDDSVPGDLEQKIFELQASGWRPPEEIADSPEDDDYNEVDLLSDNEEEESHVRRREEQLLTAEERFNPTDEQALARRLSLSSQGSNDSDLAYTQFNDNILFSSETPWSQSFQHLHPDNLVDYGNVFNDDSAVGEATPLARKTSDDAFAAQRRVRFEDEDAASDSDSSDSEVDQDLFPDLFVQQDQLDAGFRADIEADVHDLYMDDDSETGSCWDFDADEARILMMDDDDESSDSDDSSAGSSGYESDDGDTTDEEEIELPPERIRQAAEKTEADATSNSSTPRPTKSFSNIRRVTKRVPRIMQPKRGEFKMDPYKPILTVDCEKGKPDKIRIWPASRPSEQDKAFWRNIYVIESESTSRAGSRNVSPRMSVQMTPTEDNDSDMPSRQLSIDSANMIDGIFDERGRLITDQVLGPMEAFLPFMDVNASGSMMADDSFQSNHLQAVSGAEEQEQDPISSFVDFGEDDEDEEMPDESDHLMSPTSTQSFPHLGNQASSNSGGFDLLAHLDRRRGMVGSFRRNQQIAKHVGSLPSHPALRASTSESNAMQSGRRAAANTPITPLRKKKGVKGVGARNSPITSPLTKSPPMKRKTPLKGSFGR